MSRRPSFPDFIDDELLRVPMTLDAVIDAVQERWRLRLPQHAPGDGDPARALRQHRGELINQTLRTLRDLRQSGDEISEVSGCFSGTLNFLCAGLDGGRPFSALLQKLSDESPRI